MSGWELPATLLRSLQRVPDDQGAALLIRHGHRLQFPRGQDGAQVPLTEEGAFLAGSLGRHLGGRLHQVFTSPLPRCRQTAEWLIRGAGSSCDAIPSHFLGNPGPFVEDATRAWPVFLTHTPIKVAQLQIEEIEPLPGMRTPEQGVDMLMMHLSDLLPPPGQITVHVTHDIVLALTVALLLGEAVELATWPDFLEGMLVWRQNSSLWVVWRGEQREVSWPRATDDDSTVAGIGCFCIQD